MKTPSFLPMLSTIVLALASAALIVAGNPPASCALVQDASTFDQLQ